MARAANDTIGLPLRCEADHLHRWPDNRFSAVLHKYAFHSLCCYKSYLPLAQEVRDPKGRLSQSSLSVILAVRLLAL